MNNQKTPDATPYDWLGDIDNALLGAGQSCTVRILNEADFHASRLEGQLEFESPGHQLFLMVVRCHPSAIGKVMSCIKRRKTVNRAKNAFSRCGIEPLKTYALYPNHETPTLVFELNTAACRYAETHLIARNRSSVKRLLNHLLLALRGSSASVESVAILGKRA